MGACKGLRGTAKQGAYRCCRVHVLHMPCICTSSSLILCTSLTVFFKCGHSRLSCTFPFGAMYQPSLRGKKTQQQSSIISNVLGRGEKSMCVRGLAEKSSAARAGMMMTSTTHRSSWAFAGDLLFCVLRLVVEKLGV